MEISSEKMVWSYFVADDINAFSTLFKSYYPLLFNYGLKISGNQCLTEDCLQDFFVHLYNSRKKIGNVNCVKSYLFVSFRRAIFAKLKKERKYTDLNEHKVNITTWEFSAEEIKIKQEFTSIKTTLLTDMLNKLSAREKEVVYLKYYSNLKTPEISEVMEISYQSTLNTLQKAFVKLRKNLESEVIMDILKS